MLSFVVIMAPWTWPIRRPHMHLERGPLHQHVMDKLNWPTMARRVAGTCPWPQRAHLSLKVLRHSKEWTCVWLRLVDMEIAPAASPMFFPQAPNGRPLVLLSGAGSSWCGGFTTKGDAKGISDFRPLHSWWVLRVSCVVLFLKQSGLTEMEVGFPMTHDKSWNCGLVLLCKDLSCLSFFCGW